VWSVAREVTPIGAYRRPINTHVDKRRGVDFGDYWLDGSGVSEQRVDAILANQVRIDEPSRADRLDTSRVMTLVDHNKAGDSRLYRLLVDNVSRAQPIWRPGGR
jgi:hypothetical protein